VTFTKTVAYYTIPALAVFTTSCTAQADY